jgi:hypothetical protein
MKLRLSDPTNHPMFGKGKTVVQLTKDGQYVNQYVSAAEAQRQTSVNKSHIGECCRGEVKTAGSYRWMYLEDYEYLTLQND